jgi:hypothetical protein
VWISVARTGVIIKRSRLGIFGAKIYCQTDLSQVAAHCRHLDALLCTAIPVVSDPVLAPFTAAALISRNLAALQTLLSVPSLIESSYLSACHFIVLEKFMNQHGAFMERAGGLMFGYSEDLLPLPARTIGELILIYARAGLARGALTPAIRFVVRFAYGALAGALPAHEGKEAVAVIDRFKQLDPSLDQDPMLATRSSPAHASVGEPNQARTRVR